MISQLLLNVLEDSPLAYGSEVRKHLSRCKADRTDAVIVPHDVAPGLYDDTHSEFDARFHVATPSGTPSPILPLGCSRYRVFAPINEPAAIHSGKQGDKCGMEGLKGTC